MSSHRLEKPLQEQEKIARPWRIVAAEAAQEEDSQHLLSLLEELNQALEQQGVVKPDDQSRLRTSQ